MSSSYPTNVLEMLPKYEQPDLTIYEVMGALHHFECQQNPKELTSLLNVVRGKTSLLEIGSNFGGTLWRMGKELAPKSRVVSLDLPEKAQSLINPVASLKFNCQRLANMGHDVNLVIEDSHKPAVVNFIKKWAPFDFIFIDGDHSYEGVKQDWLDYGGMGKIVGFHDIGGDTQGCVQFWKELKASIQHRTDEFIADNQIEALNNQMMKLGIGIVYRES